MPETWMEKHVHVPFATTHDVEALLSKQTCQCGATRFKPFKAMIWGVWCREREKA